MGVDEIYLGKQQKFLTVVTNLETGEPLWFGRDRKKETVDEFFREASERLSTKRDSRGLRRYVRTVSAQPGAVGAPCQIAYDKFHILENAGKAVDKVRRAEFFRKGGAARDLVRGKRWLVLSGWLNLDRSKRR
jgi:hypothetical protein